MFSKRGRRLTAASGCLALLALGAAPAQAYVGPGAGLSLIGAFFALVVAVAVAVAGLIWYPFKVLMRRKKAHPAKTSGMAEKQANVSEET